jgi:integrase
MAARPRAHNLNIPNLYQKFDRRNGKAYYQYRDTRTGRFHGLGTDRTTAIKVATELNRLIAAQMVEQYHHIFNANPAKKKRMGISTGEWCERYMEIQAERLETGEIVDATFKTRRSGIKVLNDRCKHVAIRELDTKTLAIIIDEYKREGKTRMAQVLRSIWIDVFKEAQHAGEVEAGYNPALATKPPKTNVRRSRLTVSHWEKIDRVLKESPHVYCYHAALLALTTGLRREDICNLKFSDIEDGLLYVATSKSGQKTKLAFPLTLRNPILDMTLADIIGICRKTDIVSRYLVHNIARVHSTKPGDKVNVNTVTRRFAEARDKANLKWEGTPPTFHELRSLAERTYYEAGVDTQKLLGHKDRRTTDRYSDNRGSEYVVVGE